MHNFTDGVIVGAATLTALPLGITTALAVAAHQIPQEVSDYAILLDAGYTRGRAFLLNALSASPARWVPSPYHWPHDGHPMPYPMCSRSPRVAFSTLPCPTLFLVCTVIRPTSVPFARYCSLQLESSRS